VASLVLAVSDDMSVHTIELLDPMFAGGVTTTLIKTLTVICERLPEHQRLVQQRLLQELSILLDGKSYVSPGTTLPVRQIGPSFSFPPSSSSSSEVVGGVDGASAVAGVVAAAASTATAQALGGAAVPGVRSRLSGGGGGRGRGGGGGAATSSSTDMMNGSSSSGSSGSGNMLPKMETKRVSTTSRFFSKLQLLAYAATGGSSGGSGGGDGGSKIAGGHHGAGGMGTMGSQLLTAEAAEVVILALRTLGAFHMDDDVDLLPFVRDCVGQYLDNPHPLVRREAALTCCRLLLVDRGGGGEGEWRGRGTERGGGSSSGDSRKVLRVRGPSADVIEEVLKRLLQVTVADPDPSLRLTLLRALDDGFDPFLCQAHHVRILFLLLHDEFLLVRVDAIQVLGRLAALNPAYVLPPMRLALLRLLTEIKFGGRGGGREVGWGGSGKAGGKGGDADENGGQGGGGGGEGGGESRAEEATLLLGHFLRAEPLQRLVHPFIRTVVLTLPIQQGPARLAAVGLEALGELAAVVKTDIIPYLDQLVPLAIEHLHDQSSAHKREMALRALGQMASSTGYVIKPYIMHPALLPKILSVLREGGTNAMPWSLRREALRTFGVLGALDPYRFQIIQERARRMTAAAAMTVRPSSMTKGGRVYLPAQQQQQQEQLSLASSAAALGVMGGGGSHVSAGGGHSHSEMLQQFYRDGAPNMGVGGEGAAPSTMSSELVAIGVGLSDSNREEEDDDDEEEGGAHSYMYEISAMRAQPIDGTTPSGPRLTAASEDYHPTVVIKSLMNILRDSSLSAHHSMVTQAVVFIFKSLGVRCAPFLNKIVPNLLYTVRVCEHGLRESIIQELALLAPTVKHHLRPFLSPIFDVITDYWSEYLEQCVSVTENVALHLREDFKLYLPRVLPLLLSSLSTFTASSSFSPSSSKSTAVTTSGLTSSPSSLSSSLPPSSSATLTSKPSVPPTTTKNGRGVGGEGGGGGGGGEGGDMGGTSSSSSFIARKHQNLELVLRCLTVLRPVLLQEQLLHLVLPVLVTLEGSFEGARERGKEEEVAVFWQVRTMRTLAHLVRPAAAQEVARSMACPIMHMFYRVLSQGGGGWGNGRSAGGVTVLPPEGGEIGVVGGLPGELREAVMDGLVIMATQLGPQYEAFSGLIGKAVNARGLYTHPTYMLMQARVGGGGGAGGAAGGRAGMDAQAQQEEGPAE